MSDLKNEQASDYQLPTNCNLSDMVIASTNPRFPQYNTLTPPDRLTHFSKIDLPQQSFQSWEWAHRSRRIFLITDTPSRKHDRQPTSDPKTKWNPNGSITHPVLNFKKIKRQIH